jgi:MarR-like DNA-binding transcriptional regulator SgrR of sgrS sRNA
VRRWPGFLLPLLLAASTVPAALGPRYGGVLHVHVDAGPASDAPFLPPGDGDRLVAAAVHETLLGIEPGGYPVPALAETWTSTAGGREWKLTLRPDARFHDGRPAGSEDVVRSLRRFLRSGSMAAAVLAQRLEGGTSFREGSTEELPGVSAPEEASVLLRLVAPYPLPFAALASPRAAVTSPDGAGLGPFVPTLWGDGSLALTAFTDHLRGRPFLDGVRLFWPAPGAAATEAADVTADTSDDGPLAAVLLLVLDSKSPPFADPGARQAVAQEIDRQELARRFLPGGVPARSLLPPALLAPLEAPPPDRVGGRLAGELVLSVARDVPRLASQRVVAHLGALGLRVTAVPVDPGAAGPPGAAARLLLFIPEVPEAELALLELRRLVPSVAEADQALAQASLERDPDRRRVLLYRAEAALRSGDSLVPLAAVPLSFVARPGVFGARVDHRGRLILEDAWLEP